MICASAHMHKFLHDTFFLHHKDTPDKTGSLALKKSGVSIVASLDNVTRYTWRIHPWLSWYDNSFVILSLFSLFKYERQTQLANGSHLSPPPLTTEREIS